MIWYNLKDIKPVATETGDWDGKMSERLLVYTLSGTYHIAFMYEENNEIDFFQEGNDWEIKNVKCWTEISRP